jgi:DNA-binding NarL/FixJ family response regulator
MGTLYLSLPIYTVYLLWINPEAFLSQKKDDADLIYFNIDLVPHDDTEWIEEIKQNAKTNKMVAYSKNGARAARIKAMELGIKDVFVDFVSKEEADGKRGYAR